MAVLNATIQSVRNVEPVFGGHRCVSIDIEMTEAQMSELFETLYDQAPEATREGMRAYVAAEVTQ